MRPIFNIAAEEDRHWWVVLYGSYWDYWVLRYFILINLIPPPRLPRPHYWIILANGKFYFTMASVGEDSEDWSWHSDWYWDIWWHAAICYLPPPCQTCQLGPAISPNITKLWLHSLNFTVLPPLAKMGSNNYIVGISIYGQIFWRVESWFWMIPN